jgi:hypothetical protein
VGQLGKLTTFWMQKGQLVKERRGSSVDLWSIISKCGRGCGAVVIFDGRDYAAREGGRPAQCCC